MKHLGLQLWFGATCVLAAYHWPSPKFDAIEALLYELNPEPPESVSLTKILDKCQRSTFDGTSSAAEWLRFAYHDMATHNIDDGTGGLDASLYLELDRPENVGNGMIATLFDFIDHPGKYISKSDIIAIGTVLAVAECGGPTIPFRMGRIDAVVAGPPGVPEPHQDLASHIESFRKQGFTQSEMIELVACGHTLGGVRSDDFPEIVEGPEKDPNDPFQQGIIQDFDTTASYDNAVVVEYLSGTTQNPLVIAPNQTVVSDLRIFSSDNNSTMRSMATPKAFANTCQKLLERMINTVPSGVVLSNIITPLPVKVDGVQLSVVNNSLNLQAMLRLATANPHRKLTMRWANRSGGPCKKDTCSATFFNTTDTTTELTRRLGMSPQKYYFNTPINATTSISKFWFEVDEGNGKKPIILDNGGTGYQIQQDRILFDPARSGNSGNNLFTIVVAARSDVTPSRVFANVMWRITTLPKDQTFEFQPATGIPSAVGYTFYQIQVPGPNFMFDLFSVVNGTTYGEDARSTAFITSFIF